MQAGTNSAQADANATQIATNNPQTVTNGTETILNGTQTVMNGTQSVTDGISSVTNSTQSGSADQMAETRAHDSPPEPPQVLSIFLVSDLQYDIFPIYSGNGSLCNMDEGKSVVHCSVILCRDLFSEVLNGFPLHKIIRGSYLTCTGCALWLMRDPNLPCVTVAYSCYYPPTELKIWPAAVLYRDLISLFLCDKLNGWSFV
jgi:hypothetical protein